MPEILILIRGDKFLMNEIKIKLLTKTLAHTEEIRIVTC